MSDDVRLIMVVREIVGFTDDSSDEWMETHVRVTSRWARVVRRWESKKWSRMFTTSHCPRCGHFLVNKDPRHVCP